MTNYIAVNAVDKGTLQTGWDTRHNAAMKNPKGFEIPIVGMLRAMEAYASQYKTRYDQDWSTDYVLNRGLVHLAYGVRTLLNGEIGRLDAGTIDAGLVDILKACGESV